MKYLKAILVVMLLSIISVCILNAQNIKTKIAASSTIYFDATVTKIIDVNTIKVLTTDSRSIETVRLIGIDIPGNIKMKNAIIMKKKAKVFLSTVIPVGTSVKLTFDVKPRDNYGRLCAYVWKDNLMINDYILKMGFATPYLVSQDIEYANMFQESYEEAIKEKIGLWQ